MLDLLSDIVGLITGFSAIGFGCYRGVKIIRGWLSKSKSKTPDDEQKEDDDSG